ncbi:Mitogen-activated protein kinase HOG1 [Diplonema papillatum]|nr:Mitogen-activated protein kinase HOG1 [Diplonema papillatum]
MGRPKKRKTPPEEKSSQTSQGKPDKNAVCCDTFTDSEIDESLVEDAATQSCVLMYIPKGKYTKLKFVKKGSFSRVVSSMTPSHDPPAPRAGRPKARRTQPMQQVILKKHACDEDATPVAARELHMLAHLTAHPHPNVANLLDVYFAKDHLYFVLPRLPYSLLALIDSTPLPTEARENILRRVTSALKHLHAAGIVHRDVKPENIVTDEHGENVKLVDFGSATVAKKSTTASKHTTTYPFRAPETVFTPGGDNDLDDSSTAAENGLNSRPTVDCWALGCVLAEMISGKLLFAGEEADLADQHNRLLGNSHSFQLRRTTFRVMYPAASSLELDALAHLLSLDPDQRAFPTVILSLFDEAPPRVATPPKCPALPPADLKKAHLYLKKTIGNIRRTLQSQE